MLGYMLTSTIRRFDSQPRFHQEMLNVKTLLGDEGVAMKVLYIVMG